MQKIKDERRIFMEYCICKKIESVHTDTDEWGQGDVCDKCNKPI